MAIRGKSARDESGYDGGYTDDSDDVDVDELRRRGERDTKRSSALHVQPSDMEMFGVIADDSEIQQRLLSLAHRALDDIEYTMVNGTAAAKAPYTRALLGVLTRPRDEDTSSKDLEELRGIVAVQNEELASALLTREIAAPLKPQRELTVDTSVAHRPAV